MNIIIIKSPSHSNEMLNVQRQDKLAAAAHIKTLGELKKKRKKPN